MVQHLKVKIYLFFSLSHPSSHRLLYLYLCLNSDMTTKVAFNETPSVANVLLGGSALKIKLRQAISGISAATYNMLALRHFSDVHICEGHSFL